MKGDKKVIELLNEALCAELTTINRYVIHGRMCANWGYSKLAAKAHEESIEEMKHAQVLIDRILFLEGVPNMQKYQKLVVGQNAREMIEIDLQAEIDAISLYNKGVKASREAGDNGSADLFDTLLKDEEGHTDFLEAQLHLIEEIGLQNYLAQQL
ncbi:bacterioferritin [Candidatus Sumerlaeota bacterium]|nr:bacterioferritin [Candidatus Sumerlaeota bacterium]MBI3736016.1 bacterioferritin [Candidatus Sumerlaeota bacterium]